MRPLHLFRRTALLGLVACGPSVGCIAGCGGDMGSDVPKEVDQDGDDEDGEVYPGAREICDDSDAGVNPTDGGC